MSTQQCLQEIRALCSAIAAEGAAASGDALAKTGADLQRLAGHALTIGELLDPKVYVLSEQSADGDAAHVYRSRQAADEAARACIRDYESNTKYADRVEAWIATFDVESFVDVEDGQYRIAVGESVIVC